MASIKCPACSDRFKDPESLYKHILEDHEDEIPKGYTPERYVYYMKTGKTSGSCVECHKSTEWNTSTNKYHRFCNDPKCKESYVKRFRKRMIGKYGKTNLLDDPDQQRKMLANRKISGKYRWSDNTYKTYTGSYEKDFLMFLDSFMRFESEDIMTPSPHTYYYIYEGKKKFYIPDMYIPSLGLEIEIKDGGDNPNTHHKIQDVDKIKEKLKDEVMNNQKNVDYIKIVNKEYANFIEYLIKRKEEVVSKNPKEMVDESIEMIDESILYKGFTSPKITIKRAENSSHVTGFMLEKVEETINLNTVKDICKLLSYKLKQPIHVYVYNTYDEFDKGLATNPVYKVYKRKNQTIIGFTDDMDIHVLTKKGFNSINNEGTYSGYLKHELVRAIINDMNPNCSNYVGQNVAFMMSGELDYYLSRSKYGLTNTVADIYNGGMLMRRIQVIHGWKEIRRIIKDGGKVNMIKYLTEDNTEIYNRGMDPRKKYPIYVVLFSNDTSFGKLIRKVTGSEYSHACISLDPSLNNMYSFSSIPYNHAEFGEGFVRESLWSPMFEHNRYFTVMVAFVDKAGRDAVQQKINNFKKNYVKYRYNDIGLIKYYFNFKERKRHDEDRKHKYFCSEFVAYMLKTADFIEYDDIMLSPEEIIERSLSGEVLGDYTIPNFSEEKLKRETYKAYNKLVNSDISGYFEDELEDLMNESYEGLDIVEESLKDIFSQWYKSIEKWWHDSTTTSYTALIDWKKLYNEFINLFKGEDPKKRFDLIELILNKYLIPFKKNALRSTELIAIEMRKIYKKIKDSTPKPNIIKVDNKKDCILFDKRKNINLLKYPEMKVMDKTPIEEDGYDDIIELLKMYDKK